MTPNDIKRAKRRAGERRRALLGPGYVDPTQAREHIAHLRSFGLSHAGVAHLTGLSLTMVEQIVSPGHSQYRKLIHRDTHACILAARFDLDLLEPQHQVDSIGTQRRIRALARMGWSQSYIGERMGVSVQGVAKFLRPGKRYISVRNARAVRALYNELGTTAGPSGALAKTAATRGYPLPLQWDDETIDDPAAVPHTEAREVTRSAATVVEELIDLLDVVAPGITAEQAAARLGYSEPQNIYTTLRRAGRPDLRARLDRNNEVANPAPLVTPADAYGRRTPSKERAA